VANGSAARPPLGSVPAGQSMSPYVRRRSWLVRHHSRLARDRSGVVRVRSSVPHSVCPRSFTCLVRSAVVDLPSAIVARRSVAVLLPSITVDHRPTPWCRCTGRLLGSQCPRSRCTPASAPCTRRVSPCRYGFPDVSRRRPSARLEKPIARVRAPAAHLRRPRAPDLWRDPLVKTY